MNWIDRKGITWTLIAFLSSTVIYTLIPIVVRQSEFFTHTVVSHHIHLLRSTVLLLPILLVLHSIIPIRRLLDYEKRLSRIEERRFLLIIFALSFIVINLLSYYLYDHIPQGDAVSPFYQAKILAGFSRWTNPPVYPQFFMAEMVIHGGKWFSMEPLGHSLVLLPGMILGIPWIMCPLLGSLSLIVFYFLLKRLCSPGSAKIGTILLFSSPTFLFISASMLTQNSSYFFLLTALLLTAKATEPGKRAYQTLSGLAVGFAFLSRPQLTLVFAMAIIIFLLATLRRDKKSMIFYALLFIAGIAPFLLAQMVDNYVLTGSALRYGYHIYDAPNYHALGFGAGKGAATFGIPAHTPFKALVNLLYNGFVSSSHLFGWPLISFFFIPVIFLRRKATRWDGLSVGIVAGAVIFWASYWFHGISPMGSKYYYEIVPLLVLLTVRGIRESRADFRPLVTLLVLANIFVYIPTATGIFDMWGANSICHDEVREMGIHNAIVFIRNVPGKSQAVHTANRFNYASVGFRNSREIKEGDIIYAMDSGERENRKLTELYPDRKAYLFDYRINDLNASPPRLRGRLVEY
jgi:uncharacterized membrane protein (UPF0136 family)